MPDVQYLSIILARIFSLLQIFQYPVDQNSGIYVCLDTDL